jgi:hypothetical protein
MRSVRAVVHHFPPRSSRVSILPSVIFAFARGRRVHVPVTVTKGVPLYPAPRFVILTEISVPVFVVVAVAVIEGSSKTIELGRAVQVPVRGILVTLPSIIVGVQATRFVHDVVPARVIFGADI